MGSTRAFSIASPAVMDEMAGAMRVLLVENGDSLSWNVVEARPISSVRRDGREEESPDS
jgi:hypothetical protein